MDEDRWPPRLCHHTEVVQDETDTSIVMYVFSIRGFSDAPILHRAYRRQTEYAEEDIKKWCLENFGEEGYPWRMSNGTVYIRSERNAFAFKMRWM